MILTYAHFLFLFQLLANIFIFLSVNVAGMFVHNLMEHAQRKVFLDTRNCIGARLEMEDENEKLVSSIRFSSMNHCTRRICFIFQDE